MKCQSTLLLAASAVLSSTIVYASPITNNVEDIDILNNLIDTDTIPTEYVATQSSPDIILASTFPSSTLHDEFTTWSTKFNRSYKTIEEHALRKVIWLQNHLAIATHNNEGTSSYTLSHNDFSDLTSDEFQQRFYLGKYSPGVKLSKGRSDGSILPSFMKSSQTSTSRALRTSDETGEEIKEEHIDEKITTAVDAPDYKNWKEEGAVSSVKNQWFCGACWAYSAVGAIESARYIKTGNLTELSMQQLVDCDMTDLGCGGGLMAQAFQYEEDSIGLCADRDYPMAYHRHWFWGCYTGMYCEPVPNTKVAQYVNVTKTEEALKGAIAIQPVSVAVSAGATGGGFMSGWQFYSGGIFDQGCETVVDPQTGLNQPAIDHGVLAVGYGTVPPTASQKGGDYFLVKNSWGEAWGLDGYIQVARNAGHEVEGGSSCILSMASRPLMSDGP